MAGEVVNGFAALRGTPDDRTDHRQRVADPVLQFDEQRPLMLQRRLELGDVAIDAADALHAAVGVEHRKDVAAQPPGPPVLHDAVFETDALPGTRAREAVERALAVIRHDELGELKQAVAVERILPRHAVDALERRAEIVPSLRVGVPDPEDIRGSFRELAKAFLALAERRVGALERVDVGHDRHGALDAAVAVSHRHRRHAGPDLAAVVLGVAHFQPAQDSLAAQRARAREIAGVDGAAVGMLRPPAFDAVEVAGGNDPVRNKPLHLAIAENQVALAVHHADADRQHLEDARQPLLAVAQGVLNQLAIVNVDVHADPFFDFAIGSHHGGGANIAPAIAAARGVVDAQFDIETPARLDRIGPLPLGAAAILGMDRVEPAVIDPLLQRLAAVAAP